MNILSLFDGMACGMLAMLEAGVKVDRYVAYEIDKYAVQTSQHNFPMIEHRGDVFEADFTEFEGFDWLVGGSPCTYWSIAQKNNRETEASGMGWELFSQYVRALREAKPMFFIYENNKSMSKAIRQSITQTFGFDAICINSALVSAQNRQRLYWVGKRNADGTYSKVEIEQPEDRGILLRDVLEGATDREKGRSVICSAGRTTHREYYQKHQGNMAFEPVRIPDYGAEDKARPIGALYPNNCGGFEHRMFSDNPNKQQVDMIAEPVGIGYRGRMDNGKWVKQYESNGTGKANALTTAQTDSMVAEPVNTTADGKAQCVRATCYKDGIRNLVGNVIDRRTAVAEPLCMRYERTDEAKALRKRYEAGEVKHGFRELAELHPRPDGKSNTVSTVLKDNPICEAVPIYATPCEWDESGKPTKAISAADGKTYTVYEVASYTPPHGWNEGIFTYEKFPNLTTGSSCRQQNVLVEPLTEENEHLLEKPQAFCNQKYEVKNNYITIKGKQYPIKLPAGFYIIRKLTVRECMRLQTAPEWYEFPVSDSQAYKMLGNGWTVAVISHLILSAIKNNS